MMEIKHNKEENQFEYTKDGETAVLKYSIYKNKNLALTHTNVPKSLEGQGIASALADHAFEYAKKNNKMVMIYCSFIGKYIKSHPELRSQLNPEFHLTSTMKKK